MDLLPDTLPETLPEGIRLRAEHPALEGFHSPVRAWFGASFEAPTRAQELAWPAIHSGESVLILAPTGSGKTLAAFLAAIDRMMFSPTPPPRERCRTLYISPLKALAVDVEKNLRAPLAGAARYAERLGEPFHLPEIAVRTGDTPSRERAQFARRPADILITTPESLFLLLTSSAREVLRSVRSVIVDEIHTMVSTKRGSHLALSLERLEELVGLPLQRIGLSATVRPVTEAAQFLGGYWPAPAAVPRPVRIADAGGGKRLDLTVEVPVEDMARIGQVIEIPSGPAAQGEKRTSIWPAIHPMLLELIRGHRSTLIFVNSRRLAERLAAALNELAGEPLVRAHHGSLAREQRLQIEDDLKAGRLPAMVATSSLELGIDMGAIDLVVQVEAPPSVASGIQRVGRAGHQIGVPSKGIILPKFRGDLLACASLTRKMEAGEVEPMRYPRSPLDVLAQQMVGMVGMEDWSVEALYALVRRAAPFAALPRSLFDGVLDMLSGRYPSDDFAELRPRLTWDRLEGTLRAREGSKRVAIANSGTIPDRGQYGVFLVGADSRRGRSGRVGELDEEMVFESYVGDTFVLGASTWRIEEITHDRVIVSPAPGEPGRMPFWHGDRPGRPLEFGRAIGALCRTLRELPRAEAHALLVREHRLTPMAAENLLQYLDDQAAAGTVPDDRTLVVERYVDEMGDWRICLLSPFGSRVHAPWAMSIGAMVRERTGGETDILWTDDGIVCRFPESDEPPPVEWVLPDPDEVEELVVRQLGVGGGAREAGIGAPVTALFASRFREAAARALLLPRKRVGQRAPLWQQRKRAADLLRAAAQYGSFPIILETYRECLRDVFDMPALVELLRDVRRGRVRAVTVDSRTPSPFAASLLFNYVANFMYEGDSPLAERRAQALTVDHAQLRELLGEAELRELLDPGALESLELHLQHLSEERRARSADALHDLLLRLGDLSEAEIAARSTAGAAWLPDLLRARRVVPLAVAGEARYIAAEDAGRYRDALGIPPPQGLPLAFLEPVRDPLGDLVLRYARTHGPFHAEEAAAHFGIGVGPVLTVLRAQQESGRVLEGEFRPRVPSGRSGREWCEAGVLRALRQRSLARLRREAEPVEPAVLGRLSLAWQGIGARRGSPEAVLEAVEQLQGAQVPASDLESRVLPARLAGYEPHDLDTLTSAGAVLWVGCESLGERDGRVALYLPEHLPLLRLSPRERPDGKPHGLLREHLAARGASFFAQLLQACPGAFQGDVVQALWDLVWAGEVTNDTLQPLRAFLRARRTPRRGGIGSRGIGRGRALFPPETSGRWSMVDSLCFGAPSLTERLAARARQLLDRCGVLTREAAAGEEGGFTALYPVLRAMEESGRIRRGYFVAGQGATQFALPGAVDRLRALREPEADARGVVLAATDPASPYGAALPWPEIPAGRETARRAARAAGAVVILVDGALAGWMGRAERQLLTFPDTLPDRDLEEVAAALAAALVGEVESGRRRAIFVKEVDGRPAQDSPLADALRGAGFTFGVHGFMRRR